MPNINSVLNEQIRRVAKREIKAHTKVVRKATTQYRHAIAALKREVAELTKRLALVEKQAPKEAAALPEVLETARFRAMGVKAHRAKLGLSAKEYGKLAGVSELTIYHWESGKSTPRQAQKARWLAIRGLGKREALERLGMAAPQAEVAPAPSTAKPTPGAFRRPAQAQEFILSLLQGKPLLTSQINAAWKQAQRPGAANNTLWLMVKAKRIRRVEVPGQQGSAYTVGSGRLPVVAAKPAVIKSASPPAKKRGVFQQTAEELILSLLKGRKALTTKELAAAWNKDGRGGAVDNVLSRMVKAAKLKRKPLGGKLGSEYRRG